jgi:hypothetical protein
MFVGGLLLTAVTLAAPTIDKPEPWATIKGRVAWPEVKFPDRKEIEITRDKKAILACLNGEKLFSDQFVINKDNRGVQWAFVWLAPPKVEGGAKPISLPIHPDLKKIKVKEVVLDVPCCSFVPHAVGLRQGQTLVEKNSSTIAHNFRLDGGIDNPLNNVVVAPGKQQEVADLKPSARPMVMSCSIHPWMRAWVRVFDHPYFAVTDADGKFEIANAPAGDWRLFIWHEETGWLNKGGKDGEPITLKPGQTKDVGDVDAKYP